MAMSFSLQLGFFQPYSLQRHSQTPIPTNQTRNPIAYFSASTVERSHEITRSKIYSQTNFNSNGKPEIQTFIDLLRDCASKKSILEGKKAHGYLLKSNFDVEHAGKWLVLFNHVAYMYAKCSNFTYARRVFVEMPERNVFSWTVMIVGSTDNGLFLDGFRFFCEMQSHGVRPDKFAYTTVVQSCIGLDSVEYGKMVHAQIAKSEFSSNTFVNTSLLTMYAKFGKINDSVLLFKTMNLHNQVTWNAMISGFALNNLNLEPYDCFQSMMEEGFEPNIFTFASVLKAVGKLGDVCKGRQVHSYVRECNLESNVVAGTALIDMYSKCGCLTDARSVFDKNFTNCEVNTPWNAMISGYSQGGFCEDALDLFTQMRVKNVYMDLFTYGSVFNALAGIRCLHNVREVHGLVTMFGDDSRVLSVNNALMDAYAKCGSLEDAGKVFESMEERDVVSWTTMLTAYAQCLEGEKVLNVFSMMRQDNVKPNQFTFSSVLIACASLCLLDYGRQVHGLLCKDGFRGDDCVESALIDMYAKCGSIAEAEKVFEEIINPDIVSWTAIIWGYAQHGFSNRALRHFREMEDSGIKPNKVTILCVLFACSHGGMVNEGLLYFDSMKERYGLMPEMEHYACVVDILARVGRFDDAMEFINGMPINPTEMVWQTLLGACRVHGNVELGEIAAKKILSVRPDYSATYVLLSNTYIETGSLSNGLSLRNVMKERGVKKEPGFSWIVIGGRVHKFFAGDQNHPRKEDIYAKLDELREKMKAMGYVPDVTASLLDLEER
ncbi:pentatricopeptide repeat-containing protein At3g53360, mitochondrial-like [Magnolia sinica]|uniref:pentatricopeptide repeat-containing protein At3g53360, mitochondrial-like n=1 Tax=Magnolia sinica TaxID=86752 RepID=UPI0026583356|nr:pentatricopeptide repeat-containing protein At3g53360, mitochondrial-like [Magnolia sinica]